MGKAGKLLALYSEGQCLNKVRQPSLANEPKALRQSLDSNSVGLWDSGLNTVMSVLEAHVRAFGNHSQPFVEKSRA